MYNRNKGRETYRHVIELLLQKSIEESKRSVKDNTICGKHCEKQLQCKKE